MNVLIVFDNLVLSEALKHAMTDKGCVDPIQTVSLSAIPPDFVCQQGDVVVTDILCLSRLPKEFLGDCKILLLDRGMEHERVSTFFLTENVAGVISSDSDVTMLLKAIKAVHDGEIWISNSALKSLLGENLKGLRDSERLTERENELVKLLHQGLKNKEIAGALSISEQTVKSHLSRIFRKMNVSTRTELISRYFSASSKKAVK